MPSWAHHILKACIFNLVSFSFEITLWQPTSSLPFATYFFQAKYDQHQEKKRQALLPISHSVQSTSLLESDEANNLNNFNRVQISNLGDLENHSTANHANGVAKLLYNSSTSSREHLTYNIWYIWRYFTKGVFWYHSVPCWMKSARHVNNSVEQPKVLNC